MVINSLTFRAAVVLIVALSFAVLASRSRPLPGFGGVEPLLFSSGLHQPRGLAFEAEGSLLVAEAGAVGPSAAASPVAGRIVRLDERGTALTLVDGLEAATSSKPLFAQRGPAAIVRAGAAAAATYVFSGPTSEGGLGGLSRLVEAGGEWRLEPVLAFGDALEGLGPGPAAPWGAAAGRGGALYAALPMANQLVRVEAAGLAASQLPAPATAVTGFIGAGQRNPFPTGVAVARDGGVYVALFGTEPFRQGTGRVVRVRDDGRWQPYYDGLSFPVALGFAPDGQLYVLEFASGYDERAAQFRPHSGRLLTVGPGPARRRTIVSQIHYPTALTFSAAGDVYLTEAGALSPAGQGTVLRVPAQTLRSFR
jgi:hypothetical protein